MKSLLVAIIALFAFGSANAAVFTYRLANGETFTLTVADEQLDLTLASCGYSCGDADGKKFLPGFSTYLTTEGAPSYSGQDVRFGFYALGWIDIYSQTGTFIDTQLYEYALSFYVPGWDTKPLREILAVNGTYGIRGIFNPYQQELNEFCTANPDLCPNLNDNGKFQLTSIDGAPVPIPAAGIFLLTGLLGLAGIRGIRTPL